METAAPATTPTMVTHHASVAAAMLMEGMILSPTSDSEQKPAAQQQPNAQPPRPQPHEDEMAPPTKRIRRVGKLTPRTPTTGTPTTMQQQQQLLLPTAMSSSPSSPSPASLSFSATAAAASNSKVLSKHDEKWNEMFTKLLQYKVGLFCMCEGVYRNCVFMSSTTTHGETKSGPWPSRRSFEFVRIRVHVLFFNRPRN